MKLYSFPLYIFMLGFVPQFIQPQNIEKPNFAISSHPITVDKITKGFNFLLVFTFLATIVSATNKTHFYQ